MSFKNKACNYFRLTHSGTPYRNQSLHECAEQIDQLVST